jgi:hypothetical protein
MRKYHTASKRTFSLRWSLLPADAEYTVDQYAGGQEIQQAYINNSGEFTMEIYNRESARKGNPSVPEETVKVRIKDFSYSIAKRGVEYGNGKITDFWDVDLTLEEV